MSSAPYVVEEPDSSDPDTDESDPDETADPWDGDTWDDDHDTAETDFKVTRDAFMNKLPFEQMVNLLKQGDSKLWSAKFYAYATHPSEGTFRIYANSSRLFVYELERAENKHPGWLYHFRMVMKCETGRRTKKGVSYRERIKMEVDPVLWKILQGAQRDGRPYLDQIRLLLDYLQTCCHSGKSRTFRVFYDGEPKQTTDVDETINQLKADITKLAFNITDSDNKDKAEKLEDAIAFHVLQELNHKFLSGANVLKFLDGLRNESLCSVGIHLFGDSYHTARKFKVNITIV
jgi:hypothetical protein